MKTKFYCCDICGNIFVKLHDSGVIPHCCGKEVKELCVNTTDSLVEHHMPVVEKKEDNCYYVKVGKEPHPMAEKHHIQWIYVDFYTLDGRCGGEFVKLKPGDTTEVRICACGKCVRAIYAYCNIHGLWKCEINSSASPLETGGACQQTP